MKKQQRLSGKLGKTKSKSERRSSPDPRNKKDNDQVTNTAEQEEVVNEPYIKTDREEEKQSTPNTDEQSKTDAGEVEKTDESKPEA
jgi:hypothetical protein